MNSIYFYFVLVEMDEKPLNEEKKKKTFESSCPVASPSINQCFNIFMPDRDNGREIESHLSLPSE